MTICLNCEIITAYRYHSLWPSKTHSLFDSVAVCGSVSLSPTQRKIRTQSPVCPSHYRAAAAAAARAGVARRRPRLGRSALFFLRSPPRLQATHPRCDLPFPSAVISIQNPATLAPLTRVPPPAPSYSCTERRLLLSHCPPISSSSSAMTSPRSLPAIHTNVPLASPDASHMAGWCGSSSVWGPVSNGFVTPCFVHTCIMMPLHSVFCIAVSFRLSPLPMWKRRSSRSGVNTSANISKMR